MFQITDWPIIQRAPSAIRSLSPHPYLGTDWEWDIRSGRPTILGVSDGVNTVSARHDEASPYFRALLEQNPQSVIVGHNIITADLPILTELLGRPWPASQCLDTILLWWLTNMHLCKTTNKSEGEDDGAKRGRGFMNLWTMCSVHANYPNWKDCRGPLCSGPCPEHDPFGYNGTDAIVPLMALPGLLKQVKIYGLEGLYEMHVRLMMEFARMESAGVRVDVEYIAKLRAEFEGEKLQYWDKKTKRGSLPFNPGSPKQVKDFFKELGLENGQEGTIRDLLEETPEDHRLYPLLASLLDYKELGNGPDRWYANRVWDDGEWKGFVDEDGFVHPHFGPYTSTSRCQCANPNFQNVLKRRIDRKTGEKVGVRLRRGIIPREGHYFIKGDYKNAENMSYLYLADPKKFPEVVERVRGGADFHLWMAANIGLTETDEFALRNGGPREASKTVTHSNDYGEGLQLKDPVELRSPRLRSEVRAGARIVFPNWTFMGKVVTFTGANMAARAYGDKSWASRAKALGASERYFAQFPAIRDLQRRITKQVEKEHIVRPPHGYVLKSMGYLEDQVKTALATWGQQPVAHHIKLAHLNAASHPNLSVVLNVHDELLAEVDERVPKKKAKEMLRECMEIESKEMPGFRLLTDIVWGKNWSEKNECD